MSTTIDALTDEICVDLLNVRRTISRLYDEVKENPARRAQVEKMVNDSYELYSYVNSFMQEYYATRSREHLADATR